MYDEFLCDPVCEWHHGTIEELWFVHPAFGEPVTVLTWPDTIALVFHPDTVTRLFAEVDRMLPDGATDADREEMREVVLISAAAMAMERHADSLES